VKIIHKRKFSRQNKLYCLCLQMATPNSCPCPSNPFSSLRPLSPLQVNLFQRGSKYFALGESKYIQLFEGPTTPNGAILGVHFFRDKSDFTPGYLCLAGSHYGLLDWTSPKWCKVPFPAFFSVGEKLIIFIQPTSLLNLLFP